ncbi:MAG: ribosome maturation factor RimM [Culicoidibacterales bacterium]
MKKIKYVVVGDIVNTHGLKGEVRILSDSDFKKERFTIGNELFIRDKQKNIITSVTIAKYRVHKNFDLLTFVGMENIADVEKYKSFQLCISRDLIRDLTEGEGYYFDDITACDVFEGEQLIGKVYKIIPMQSYDLWYIKRPGKKDILLPFTGQFVKRIEIEQQKIYVELLEGMNE